MAIEKISIKNFTLFKNIEIDFSSKVNIFIGENGTGKTHLLKILNTIGSSSLEASKIFGISQDLFYEISKQSNVKIIGFINKIIFIPAKDMLTHSKGLIEMSKKYSKEMPFDTTLLDIIERAKQWKVDEVPEIAKKIIPIVEKIIGGVVIIENDTFFILKQNGDKINFSLEAEGIKKIGLLWQLLMNENITKDSILIWDEPEANINPKIIPDLVEIVLELSRQGVQVFIATHDYVLAKYFEVKSQDIPVVFHSLYKTESCVKCESKTEFRNLKNNPILKAFNVLMDEVIDRNLGD